MKRKYIDLLLIAIIAAIILTFKCARADETSAYNSLDDYCHFAIGGCFGGLFSLAFNDPYEDLYIRNKRNGSRIYAGQIVKKGKGYNCIPGLLGGLTMEGLNALRHPDHIDMEHFAFGMAGSLTADIGVGIILKTW